MLPSLRGIPVFALGAVALGATPARAQAPSAPPASFALVVGSNRPGPGQQELPTPSTTPPT
jgi:hypothetical protein